MDRRYSSTNLIVHSDYDDDDIIILDPPDVLQNDIEHVLNQLINRLIKEEKRCRQIDSISKANVRFNGLFVSEKLSNKIRPQRPFAQFLCHLGTDLCLEYYPNDWTNSLSFDDQRQLKEMNKIFHHSKIYSCEFCSFKTESNSVLDRHYLTPHNIVDHRFRHEKFRCTFCLFQTFRLSQLQRHYQRKHQLTMISDGKIRHYSCCFCTFDTDDKLVYRKHEKQCRIEQDRVRLANNLLASIDKKSTMKQSVNDNRKQIVQPLKAIVDPVLELHSTDEPILIESDHDSPPLSVLSSWSDEFTISSNDENTSDSESDDASRGRRTKRSAPVATSISSLTTKSHLPSLSKLLVLNGARSEIGIVTPIIPPPPPPPVKPIRNCDKYQNCSVCGCYIFKSDFLKHFHEKHLSPPISSIAAPPPVLITSKTSNEIPQKLFLLSTSSLDQTSFSLNMIKCPWCDANVEHIDVITGHLMRYHRMTLAASKVVVAEQMKLQSSATSHLSTLFRQEMKQIQNDFVDRTYWKVVQPKIYLNRMNHISCFVCQENLEDIENHLLTSHQIKLETMNKLHQCFLCGFQCKRKEMSFFEHQLRVHSGVCYSTVLKQFLLFEPPPADYPVCSSSRLSTSLDTLTEKKFGCRKCVTNKQLFTFDELVEHLRFSHQLNVKLHRRCVFCSKTFPKGKEFNEHCLEHLVDENPSIFLRRCT